VAALDVLTVNETNALVSASMVGGISGFVAGHTLTRNTRFSAGQGSLVTLGELGGGLLGIGTAYLITRGKGSERPYVGLAAIGSVAGFWFAYKAFTPSSSKKSANWDVRVSPQALLSLSSSSSARIVPGVSVSITH